MIDSSKDLGARKRGDVTDAEHDGRS